MKGAAVVRTRGLTKTYGSITALDDLDLNVPSGLVGLVGANGAGKSTLFRLLLGLARPTAGTVEVCGLPVGEDPIRVRTRIGYMPEHDCLPLDQTAADVVATLGEIGGLSPRVARQRASEVLDLVGLDEARFRPVGGFSTGMRQRTKLAQALVAGPELVLLDEPTAGLDPSGREEMLELVARLAEFDISVIMATHLLDDVADVCDHVIMLDAGRLVADAAVQSLQALTGTLIVDTGSLNNPLLVSSLHAKGLDAALSDDGGVEVFLAHESDTDLVRDLIADLELPLYQFTRRSTSLDEAFLKGAAARRSVGVRS